MAIIIHRFDRFDNPLGVLNDIISAEWTESLDGTDEIELTIGSEVSKGDRLVWRDVLGAWHEHIVYFTERTHSDTKKFRVLAENSISELYGDYILDKRPTATTAGSALLEILSGAASERSNNTRWQAGTITVTGTNSATFYRQSVRECLADILDIWGGELSTTITVSGSKVTSRAINITHRGSDNGRWFEYGHNIAGITRTYSDEGVVTALYGFGKGEAVGDGYGRRIDFSSQGNQTRGNISHVSGKMYVQNDTAKNTWGRPDTNGVKQHVYSKVEFDDIETEAELLTATMDELEKLCEPKISYEADVIDFVKAGYEIAGSQIGDTIRIIDTVEGFEVRAVGRVVKTVKDMLNESSLVKLTIGNIIDNLTDYISDYEQRLRKINNRSSAWDAGAYTTYDYIKQVMERFNEEFESGGVYKYESFTDTMAGESTPIGVIYSSVPLSSSYKPTRTPAKAIQLRGGAFRISNTIDSSGNFVWTTAGDGSGFTASVINVGRLVCGQSYIDLDHGEIHLVDYYDKEHSYSKSEITAKLGSISLEVTSGTPGSVARLGSVASIKLTVDGTTETETINLTNMRSAWASDTTAVTVTGGKITMNGGGITFNSNTLVVNSTKFTLDASGNASFSGNLSAPSGTIGGFTIGSTSIYKSKTTLKSNTSGVYIGTDGISVGSGSCYTGLYSGYLRGGTGSDEHGYVGFNNYWTPSGVYGTRLAGKGCVAIYTNGAFGVGSYTSPGESGTISTGVTHSFQYVSEIHDAGGGSIGWTTTTVQFVHGLLNSS